MVSQAVKDRGFSWQKDILWTVVPLLNFLAFHSLFCVLKSLSEFRELNSTAH